MFASKLLLSVALLGVASSRVHSGAKIQSRVVAYSRLVCQISRVACSIACSVHSVGTLKLYYVRYRWLLIQLATLHKNNILLELVALALAGTL